MVHDPGVRAGYETMSADSGIFLDWQAPFATGIATVDHDHWHLVLSLNEVHSRYADAATGYAAADFLGDVHALLAGHFAHEEKYMRRAAHPDYERHRAAHTSLLDAISDRMEAQLESDRDFDAAAFAGYLRDWLTEHFHGLDARLGHARAHP